MLAVVNMQMSSLNRTHARTHFFFFYLFATHRMLLTDLVIVSFSLHRISQRGEAGAGEEGKNLAPLIPRLAVLCCCSITMKEKKGKGGKKRKATMARWPWRTQRVQQIESIYLSVPELLIPVQLFV